MYNRPYHFDALIYCLDRQPDRAAAGCLRDRLEKYSPPHGCGNVPLSLGLHCESADGDDGGYLGFEICSAVEQSRRLVLVCSAATRDSAVCARIIEYFIQTHGGTADILTVLAEGGAEAAIPRALWIPADGEVRFCRETGEDAGQRRPPAPTADIRADSGSWSRRKLKSEFLRVAAPLLGCDYDRLLRGRMRRSVVFPAAAGIAAVTLCVMAAILALQSGLAEQNSAHTKVVEGTDYRGLQERRQNEWDRVVGEPVIRAEPSLSPSPAYMIFSNDGSRLLLYYNMYYFNSEADFGNQGRAEIYSAGDFSLEKVIKYDKPNFVYSFSDDLKIYVRVTADDTAEIVETETGRVLLTITAEKSVEAGSEYPVGIYPLGFSDDNRYIALATYDNVDVWDLESGEKLSFPPGRRRIAPDFKTAVIERESGKFWIYDIQGGKWLYELPVPDVRYVTFHPDGSKVLCLPNSGRTIELYNIGSRELEMVAELPEPLPSDGGFGAYLLRGGDLLICVMNGQAYSWNLTASDEKTAEGVPVARLTESEDSDLNLWIAPFDLVFEGKKYVLSGTFSAIKLNSVQTGEVIGELEAPTRDYLISQFAVSPDGSKAVVSTEDGAVWSLDGWIAERIRFDRMKPVTNGLRDLGGLMSRELEAAHRAKISVDIPAAER